jgi:hypothetical protein
MVFKSRPIMTKKTVIDEKEVASFHPKLDGIGLIGEEGVGGV